MPRLRVVEIQNPSNEQTAELLSAGANPCTGTIGTHSHNPMPTWIIFILVTAALTAVVGLLVWLGSRAMRGARRGVPSACGLGWVLLFMSSGRMPPPPPASHIEQETQTRKDRLASQQDDDP